MGRVRQGVRVLVRAAHGLGGRAIMPVSLGCRSMKEAPSSSSRMDQPLEKWEC